MAMFIGELGERKEDSKIPFGNMIACYGQIIFTAGGDVYATATGLTGIARLIRRTFGVGKVHCISFFGASSDASGPTTGAVIIRYDAVNDIGRMYLTGRTSGSPGTAQASEVEIADGASINNTLFQLVAYCTGSGVSTPSRMT